MKHEPRATEGTVVTGVVHPLGAGGVRVGGADVAWTLKFTFETWRREDGLLCGSELVVRRQVTDTELREYRARIRPYQVVAVRVRHTGDGYAELLELLDQDLTADSELLRRAEELMRPQTREHELFGTFTLDRRIGWYEATTTWAGGEVRLNLAASDDVGVEAALRAAMALWRDQASWNERILDYAAERLLELKNTAWLEDEDDEITADQFKASMTLESITVSSNGTFEFWHDDGDLFWGHAIQVRGSLDGPTGADIHG